MQPVATSHFKACAPSPDVHAALAGYPRVTSAAAALMSQPMDEFHVETVTDPRQIADEWRAFETTTSGSFFQSYQWCATWCASAASIEGEKPLIVVGRDRTGAIAFLWPMALVCQYGICSLSWLAQSRSAYNMGLFRPDVAAVITRSMLLDALQAALADHPRVATLRFCGQPVSWRGARNPFLLLSPTPSATVAYQREIGANADAILLNVLSKRQRKLIRQKTRKLSELGTVQIKRAETARERLAVLETFLGQKSIQLAERDLGNVFSEHAVQRFFRDLAVDKHTTASHEYFSIQVGERTAATVIGHRHDDVFHALAISMTSDPDVAKHSPGLLLMHGVVRAQCESGAQLFDLGPGGGQHKSTWDATEVAMFETHRSLRLVGGPSAWTLTTITASKRMLKANPQVADAARALKSLPRRLQRSAVTLLRGRADRPSSAPAA